MIWFWSIINITFSNIGCTDLLPTTCTTYYFLIPSMSLNYAPPAFLLGNWCRFVRAPGAGFYLDATMPKWQQYRMYSYIVRELPELLATNFPSLDTTKVTRVCVLAIFGCNLHMCHISKPHLHVCGFLIATRLLNSKCLGTKVARINRKFLYCTQNLLIVASYSWFIYRT